MLITIIHFDRIKSMNRTRNKNGQFVFEHGLDNHPLYKKWRNMKYRCYNTNDTRFHVYGGKGIIVCDEWKNDFMAFYSWAISHGWQKELWIDRIDTNGNYEPSNCRFVTESESSENKGIYNRKHKLPKGVYFGGNTYQSMIRVNKKLRYLGRFDTVDAALARYQNEISVLKGIA